jgi:integrase
MTGEGIFRERRLRIGVVTLGRADARGDRAICSRSALIVTGRNVALVTELQACFRGDSSVSFPARYRDRQCEMLVAWIPCASAISEIEAPSRSIALAKLRPLHVQDVYGRLLARGLSATTVRHAHGLLKSVLSWAVRMQLVTRNVAEAVDAPKRVRSEADALNDDEVIRILDAKTLVVRASLSQTKGGVVLKGTKTNRVRTLPLTPMAFEVLRERRRAFLAERLAAGASYDDQAFVITDPFGRAPKPSTLTVAFRDIAEKAKVKKRLHDSRHSYATMLIGEKLDPQTVATLLEVNANVTLAIYSHQIAGHKEAAVAKVGDRLQSVLDRRRKA